MDNNSSVEAAVVDADVVVSDMTTPQARQTATPVTPMVAARALHRCRHNHITTCRRPQAWTHRLVVVGVAAVGVELVAGQTWVVEVGRVDVGAAAAVQALRAAPHPRWMACRDSDWGRCARGSILVYDMFSYPPKRYFLLSRQLLTFYA